MEDMMLTTMLLARLFTLCLHGLSRESFVIEHSVVVRKLVMVYLHTCSQVEHIPFDLHTHTPLHVHWLGYGDHKKYDLLAEVGCQLSMQFWDKCQFIFAS